MGRVEEMRAKARALYGEAAKIKHVEERLIMVLQAFELDTEADTLDQQNIPPLAEASQHVAQQQQQPQPDDDKE